MEQVALFGQRFPGPSICHLPTIAPVFEQVKRLRTYLQIIP